MLNSCWESQNPLLAPKFLDGDENQCGKLRPKRSVLQLGVADAAYLHKTHGPDAWVN